MNVEEILKRPYARVFLQDEATGRLTGLILEFPGCIAEGKDAQEAWDRLNDAATVWLTAHIANNRSPEVPEPFEPLNPQSRQSVSRLVPLWNAVTKWRDKHKVTGDECLYQRDSVNEDLGTLAEKTLKVVGYYKYPEDE